MRLENNTENLGLALSNSIKSEYLEELGTDILELVADSLTDSDIISDIPIVGMFYKAGKSLISMRDNLFLKKILVFLKEHQDIPLEKRVQFLSKFETEKDKQVFGEAVLMLLDNLNHIQKAQIVGKLSRALLLGLINHNDFSVLCESVDKLYIVDLHALRQVYKTKKEAETDSGKLSHIRLFNAGLLWNSPTAGYILTETSDPNFEEIINPYGKLLVEIVLFDNETS